MIDVHTHGLGGYETRGASPGDILAMARLQGSAGVEAFLPTIFPAPIEEMRRDIFAVRAAMLMQREEGKALESLRWRGSRVFISKGPFSIRLRRAPLTGSPSSLHTTADTWRKLVEGFEDIVRVITIAPELDGARRAYQGHGDNGGRRRHGPFGRYPE